MSFCSGRCIWKRHVIGERGCQQRKGARLHDYERVADGVDMTRGVRVIRVWTSTAWDRNHRHPLATLGPGAMHNTCPSIIPAHHLAQYFQLRVPSLACSVKIEPFWKGVKVPFKTSSCGKACWGNNKVFTQLLPIECRLYTAPHL